MLRISVNKLAELSKAWAPSAAAFGGGATVLLCYFTEWKAVLQYVPIYSGKYKE